MHESRQLTGRYGDSSLQLCYVVAFPAPARNQPPLLHCCGVWVLRVFITNSIFSLTAQVANHRWRRRSSASMLTLCLAPLKNRLNLTIQVQNQTNRISIEVLTSSSSVPSVRQPVESPPRSWDASCAFKMRCFD